ncbi:MAG: S41 family peptidase [Gemmatimonadaceae bacterium]
MIDGFEKRSRWIGMLAASAVCSSGCTSIQPAQTQAVAAQPAPSTDQPISARLALATFDSVWTIVRRTYVDTAFVANRWGLVRDSIRPLAAVTTSRSGLSDVLAATLRPISDSHFYIIPARAAAAVSADGDGEGGEGTTGMAVRIAGGHVVVWSVVPGSPAAIAGVVTGRRVDQIGNRVTSTSLSRLASLPEVSRQRSTSQLLQRLNGALSPSVGDTIQIRLTGDKSIPAVTRTLTGVKADGTISKFGNLPPIAGRVRATRRNVGLAGQPSGESAGLSTGQLTRQSAEESAGPSSRQPPRQPCIGTIAFNIWLPALAPELERAVSQIADCTGVIIDLRGNPGGVGAMVMGFGGYFVDSARSLGTMRTRDVSLQFVINPRFVQVGGMQRGPYQGPVAILVDPMTASTSEIFATGMQRLGRMRVFGERSAGAALPALMRELPSGDVFVHAVADFTDPDGRRIEGAGVVPDEIVLLSEKDLLKNVDAPLEAAARWIRMQGR